MKKLVELRSKIDEIDQELVKLLDKRAQLALEIGREKERVGLPTKDLNRESQVLKNLESLSLNFLDSQSVGEIFSSIFSTFVKMQDLRRQSKKKESPFQKIGIFGCGLMGGSFALALNQTFDHLQVTVCDPNVGDENFPKNFFLVQQPEQILDMDLIVLAAPISENINFIRKFSDKLKSNCVVLDLGSTKSTTLNAVLQQTHRKYKFVGGHPLVGKHLSGLEYADANMFLNKTFVFTCVETDVPESVQEIVSAIGALPVYMKADQHDKALSLLSHLPHLIGLALFLTSQENEAMARPDLCPRSFRDVIRLSASSPEVWFDVFTDNKVNIKKFAASFQKKMELLIENIELENKELLKTKMSRAKTFFSKLEGEQSKYIGEDKNDNSSKKQQFPKSVA